MADFDPDSYLAAAAPTPFNPDEYLNAVGKPQPTPPPQTFAPGSPREIAREQLADQPVVQQQMERAGRAVANTAVETVKSLPSMLKFIAPPKLTDILTGASETLGQIKQIEQSPVGSQEWWNAVVPVASQVAMEVGGLRVASPKLTESIFGKPPVQTDIPLTSAAEEVTKNATQEGKIQESIQPERARDDARGASTETGVGGGIRPTTEVQKETVAPEVSSEGFKVDPRAAGVWNSMSPEERWNHLANENPFGVALNRAEFQKLANTPWEEIQSGSKDILANRVLLSKGIQPIPTEILSPSTKAAAVSGAETPPAAVPQIPEDAKATVQFKTTTGERVSREMNAREAEGIFTKEKSSYQALLDCLGA